MTNHATNAAKRIDVAEAAEAIYHEVDCIEADFNRKEVERVLALYFEKVKDAAAAELRGSITMQEAELFAWRLAFPGLQFDGKSLVRFPLTNQPERGVATPDSFKSGF